MGLCMSKDCPGASRPRKHFGSTTRSTAFLVFLYPDLVRAITQYQAGVFVEELAFLGHPCSGRCLQLSEYSVDSAEFDLVDQTLRPWYRLRGHARPCALLLGRRDLLRIVFLHAVYFGELAVLESLHHATQILHQDDPRRRYGGRSAIDGRPQVVHNHDLFDLVATKGHVHVLAFLHTSGYQQKSPRAIQRAVVHGHLAILEYMYAHQLGTCTSRAMDLAAAGGFLEIVKFLHVQLDAVGCTTQAVDHAAANGHVRVVQWLLETREEGGTSKALATAKANGHHEVVTYLRARGQDERGTKRGQATPRLVHAMTA
ncbi:Aste57867_15583 [Aphanomyces stellatus]|uniref:Aste57867_15583 protein n=1 Tax=Aphanomyces stellatus TaxID=120398 RepID=A0A485L426_9STRA|nr:hypothetical protein As57867_015527 [Aphanomyces stellatus]VFT92385.1 Aste57867_15583 [Aphanomyces stellatus]